MLCQVCKDRLESIGKPLHRCLKNHIPLTKRLGREELERLKLAEFGMPDSRHPLSLPRMLDRFSLWYFLVDQHFICRYIRIPTEKCWCVEDQHPFGHHRNSLSLKRSAKQGCIICSELPFDFNQNDQRNHTWNRGFCTILTVGCLDSAVDNGRFTITVESSQGIKLVELLPKIDCGSTLNFNLSNSTDSPETWSIICNWMGTCSSSHEHCKRNTHTNDYKPTRLLEANFQSHSRHGHTFRIVHGHQCPKISPYVTLSYRWGNKPLSDTLRLLKETSDWLCTPNPIKTLPKTFKDAMYIAHRFGIKYIWIDRLCIYQDSPEDWRKEAGTMQDVYRNASFCISALSAEDDEGGCFYTRNPRLVAPTPINLNKTDITLRADLEDSAWCTSFQDEPLLERGWVLQERLMSPRTLYFGKNQVFWECAELHACETHPAGFGTPSYEQGGSASPILWKQLIATPTTQPTASDSVMQIFSSWSAAMTVYSSTRLTEPSDKLVAVSGLAKDIRRSLQSRGFDKHRYLAGLWEHVLVETLAWYVRIGVPASRTTKYRAPSWSWASLDGQIFIPNTFSSEASKLSYPLCSTVEFLGGDDTREVIGAQLTLYGPMCLINTSDPSSNQYKVKSFRLRGETPIVFEEDMPAWPGRSTVIFDTEGDFRDQVVCLWITTQPAEVRGWKASGIVLHNINGIVYQRIGVVSCYNVSKPILDRFIGAFPPQVVNLV
ncbi:HET-domain-containing protein [Rostrohypoxylon terebratum]|nr:HET-domain-containing protein [Rostrohypoxylon terebratum]